jgi:hypothetical protein
VKVVVAEPAVGDRVPTNAAAMRGCAALMRRGGGVEMTVKARHAQLAGAAMLIVVNSDESVLVPRGALGSAAAIPVVGVARSVGELFGLDGTAPDHGEMMVSIRYDADVDWATTEQIASQVAALAAAGRDTAAATAAGWQLASSPPGAEAPLLSEPAAPRRRSAGERREVTYSPAVLSSRAAPSGGGERRRAPSGRRAASGAAPKVTMGKPWSGVRLPSGEPSVCLNDALCPPCTRHGASIRRPFGAGSSSARRGAGRKRVGLQSPASSSSSPSTRSPPRQATRPSSSSSPSYGLLPSGATVGRGVGSLVLVCVRLVDWDPLATWPESPIG